VELLGGSSLAKAAELPTSLVGGGGSTTTMYIHKGTQQGKLRCARDTEKDNGHREGNASRNWQ